ncbi:50S ribosomal protein L7/L12 [candidate division KSB3 bacterium]|uniref:Large ribosomal subunit protein bL12 n=1 Tax=candidate division KSB3 bacterium TaxID=2044937 RepID=A0A2G6E0Q7_9BACT|nr:MAG: 50S ribosomal protein L7/L12 [candidate division KSB3 bacterium]PIE31049.1 MAG: 50S ribosomal protein L7/L12 [candidate division KSB3 bacterium]
MADITMEDVLSYIDNMTVLQLNELVEALKEKYGVTAAAPVAVAAVAGGGEAAAEEEQTEFTVVLVSPGDKKIQVIKEVRSITGLGLKEAKALVDGAPANVKEAISKEEANEIKEKIEAAGGQADVK